MIFKLSFCHGFPFIKDTFVNGDLGSTRLQFIVRFLLLLPLLRLRRTELLLLHQLIRWHCTGIAFAHRGRQQLSWTEWL